MYPLNAVPQKGSAANRMTETQKKYIFSRVNRLIFFGIPIAIIEKSDGFIF